MDFNVQNSPAFGTKVIQTKEFKRLGKFAENEIGPQIKAALKDYAGDNITVKLGSEIFPEESGRNKVTFIVSNGVNTRKDKKFLDMFRSTYWEGSGMKEPTKTATKKLNEFICNIKGFIDDLV